MNRWPWPWKQRPNQGQGGANPTPPANVPVNATGGVSSPSNVQGATTPLPTPRSALLGHPGAIVAALDHDRAGARLGVAGPPSPALAGVGVSTG